MVKCFSDKHCSYNPFYFLFADTLPIYMYEYDDDEDLILILILVQLVRMDMETIK